MLIIHPYFQRTIFILEDLKNNTKKGMNEYIDKQPIIKEQQAQRMGFCYQGLLFLRSLEHEWQWQC
jgi:hypothetical protein